MFVDVILPLNLKQLYTYSIPKELDKQVVTGKRLVVQFGKKRIYTALAYKIHDKKPDAYQPKAILSVLDESPVVNEFQFQLWDWMSKYYMASHGSIMNAALPSALKLESESKVLLNDKFGDDFSELDNKEYLIAEALLVNQTLTIQEVQQILDQKTVYHILQSLLKKGVIIISEDLKEKYKPKTIEVVLLKPSLKKSEQKLKAVFDDLQKAPQQLKLLMTYLHLEQQGHTIPIPKEILLKEADVSSSIYKQLVNKGILTSEKTRIDRVKSFDEQADNHIDLSEAQQEALNEIKDCFKNKSVTLLHGVTSSGKTQIYINLIQEALNEGRQVLYLLPEIALTSQITDRLKKVFGKDLGIYHSKFNDNERVEIWNKTLHSEYKVILGVRSSIFLPFDNLGLIVVDEEHDSSYKQFDPSPRYNARDTAVFLSTVHKEAKVLLGSATPSLESRKNAEDEKYGLVRLNKRFADVEMPQITMVDTIEEKRKNRLKSHFTSTLIEHIEKTLEQKEQVILFQNRRGYAPYLECSKCSWIPQCKFCDVSMTYHKYSNDLRCHYCGFRTQPINTCSACGSHEMKVQSFGTEKIEDELRIFFPEALVGRMDLDTVRTKHGHEKVIREFENKQIDILIGTQMITKGLDFDNVGLVGVLSADHLLNFPNFRAGERAFQLITQVSGRAGRKKKRGKVVVQTSNPEHPILLNIKNNDFISFYANELIHRKQFKYPPYYRLIRIVLKHKKGYEVIKAANQFYGILKKQLASYVIGPSEPIINRIKSYYLQEILIKIDKDDIARLNFAKKIAEQSIDQIQREYKSTIFNIDVDPY